MLDLAKVTLFDFFYDFNLQVWFGDHMFQNDFNFYKGYVIPSVSSINQFREAIQDLPPMDTPEVFGLHANADIT